MSQGDCDHRKGDRMYSQGDCDHRQGDHMYSQGDCDHRQGDHKGSPLPWTGVSCPFCGSDRTELFSLFGQQLLTVQYYCNSCHTPFERVKDDDVLNDFAARKESDA
jgi:hypothetical protein